MAELKNTQDNNQENVELQQDDQQSTDKFVESKEKIKLQFWRIFWTWPRFVHFLNKAKKIIRKNSKTPDYYSEEYRYMWLKKVCRYALYVTNVKIEVIDVDNWLDRGVILAPNHQSNFDPVYLYAINDFDRQQPLAFIAKKELWKSKFFARFVKLIDVVPLDRNSPRSALEAVRQGKDLVASYKRSLVVFPSGTRTSNNELGEWKGAALKVAQMAYAPVIPVTIINSDKTFAHKGKLIVRVVFGKPFLPEKNMSIKTEMLTQNVRKEVQKNMDKFKDIDATKLAKPTPKQKPKKKKGFLSLT